MPRVVVRDVAREDLEHIFSYIANDSLEAALRVYDAVEASFLFLCRTPGAGPQCEFPEPNLADLRFWPVTRYRNYLVIYRPLPDGVEIVRVLHAATDIRRAFRGT